MAKDPVCGMATEQLAANMLEYEGHIFFFCSDDCKTRFKSDPAKYISTKEPDTGAVESQHAHHGMRHGCC